MMALTSAQKWHTAIWIIILVLSAWYVALMVQQRQATVLDTPREEPLPELPDFASISQVDARKQAYFGYFSALVDTLNQRIAQDRAKLVSLADKPRLTERELHWLTELADQYRITLEDQITSEDVTELLLRVDSLPASLVITQAAIESGWGTSRFALEGNNFFGQWCYTAGCGLIPGNRAASARHEVQTFSSAFASLQSYFNNLNSHAAYAELREIRANLRAQNQPLHGCILAHGLSSYSERGKDYIDEVRHFIRFNQLSPHGYQACQTQAQAPN